MPGPANPLVPHQRRAKRRGQHRPTFRPTLEPLEGRLVPYALSGYSWANTNISASFMPDGTKCDDGVSYSNLFTYLNGIASSAIWQREYARALQSWADSSPLNFHFVSDNGAPESTAGLPQGDSRFGDIRVGGYIGAFGIAHSSVPDSFSTSGGDQFLSTGYTFGIPGNSSGTIDLYSTVLHEFGHGIGLLHSTNQAAVMYPSLIGVYTGLSADDIAGVQAIYGVRRLDAYDAAGSNNSLTAATSLPLSSGAATISADITTMTDVDYYKVTAPSGFDGTLTVSLDARNLSLFAPKVSVYDAAGNLLKTASVDFLYGYGSVATANLSGLTAGNTYYIRAAGATTDVFGMGAYKLNVQFGGGVVTVTVNAPSGLTANAISSSQVNLAWTDNATNETSYHVDSSLNGTTWTTIASLATNSSSYVHTAVSPGTTYYYRVCAVNGATLSDPSNVASATLAPLAPATLTAAAISSSQIQLTWSDVAGETGFKIERSSGGSSSWMQVGTTGAGVTSFQDAGLAAATSYYYRVRAWNAGGNSAYSIQASAATSGSVIQTSPPAPTNLIAVISTSTRINLSWADNSSNETGFVIQRMSSNGKWATIGQVGANVTTFSDTTVNPRKAYQYRVYAFNSVGNSGYSNTAQPFAGLSLSTVEYLLPPFNQALVNGLPSEAVDEVFANREEHGRI